MDKGNSKKRKEKIYFSANIGLGNIVGIVNLNNILL